MTLLFWAAFACAGLSCMYAWLALQSSKDAATSLKLNLDMICELKEQLQAQMIDRRLASEHTEIFPGVR